MTEFTEYELAEMEASHWEELRESVQQLMYQLEEKRSNRIKESGNRLTPEHDKLEHMLEGVMSFIDGRIEEQQPGSYKHRCEFYYHARGERREMLQYALQEGINAVALECLPYAEWRGAIEYISDHGVLSMNYEASKKAVIDYCIDENARKYGVVLDRKEAERIWA